MYTKQVEQKLQQTISASTNFAHKKTLEKILKIVSFLKSKDMCDKQNKLDTYMQSILNMDMGNAKLAKSILRDMIKFLKVNFSFINRGYFTSMGLFMGLCIGLISYQYDYKYGIIIATLIGIALGFTKEKMEEKKGRVYKM